VIQRREPGKKTIDPARGKEKVINPRTKGAGKKKKEKVEDGDQKKVRPPRVRAFHRHAEGRL